MTRVHRICTGCMSTIQLARVLLNRATRVACFWTRLSVSWRFMASVRVVVSIFEAQRRWLESWHCDVSSSGEGDAENETADLLRVLQFDIKHIQAKWSYIPLIHITPYCWWLKSCTSWYGKYIPLWISTTEREDLGALQTSLMVIFVSKTWTWVLAFCKSLLFL